jgi:hypothetical protein
MHKADEPLHPTVRSRRNGWLAPSMVLGMVAGILVGAVTGRWGLWMPIGGAIGMAVAVALGVVIRAKVPSPGGT